MTTQLIIGFLIAFTMGMVMALPDAFTTIGAIKAADPERHWTYRPCNLIRQDCLIG